MLPDGPVNYPVIRLGQTSTTVLVSSNYPHSSPLPLGERAKSLGP
jgi:hypothetical protein